MSSSSWAQKLSTRLSTLADAASPESIQSLAKWLSFNRKHGPVLADAMHEALSSPSSSEQRQWLYLQVIHEVLLLEHANASKWERLLDFRVLLGERAVLPCVTQHPDWAERVAPLLKEWDHHNVFGGPTLISQIQKALSSSSSTPDAQVEVKEEPAEGAEAAVVATKPTTAVKTKQEEEPQEEPPTTSAPSVPEKSGSTTVEMEESKRKQEEPPSEEKENPPQRRASTSASEPFEFDFEKEGIPYAKVDAREFLEPCKAIATLQIARDLRNDAAVQLSSLLSNIPEQVRQVCEEARLERERTGEEPEAISKEQAETYSGLLSDEVLDLDIEEALQNAETFLEIVRKQQQARKVLIQLLIQSRCQFGSEDAAEAFFRVDETMELLQKRKQVLSDAMELEGLDFEEGDDSKAAEDDNLEPLSWYNASSDPEAKRAKLE